MPIHPTAVVDRRAEIDPTADIGPYVVVDGPVRVGARTRVMPYAFLTGPRTEIGADNVIHPGAVIGHEPQDVAYTGGPTGLRIGDRNVIREHAEVHRATKPETWTEVGDDVYLMARAHVAHNCRVGNRAVIASGAMVAGYVEVGERAFVSGNCVVHQYTRIGRLTLMRGLSRASRDLPPFAIVDGTHTVRALNRVGLRRAGFDAARIRTLATAFRILFHARTNLSRAIARVEAELRSPDVDELLEFIRTAKRGVAMGPRAGAADASDTDE
ncbi:MAG TPA: acyl-ACP--UDP-N-acetylglucosamine O-acyltransferase [Candidatus Binatia bacterium]|nr:acyl-ACP--UDP-N-acetylglucosamine O-acyltransferase [Candidatus Binatia bacterium]